jgi:hypothetical protein
VSRWTRDDVIRHCAVCAATGNRIDLSGADLSRADLIGASLRWADLSGADLSRADLSWADLSWANLSGADLSGASLSGASLSGASLSGASLSGASLSRAGLSWADLSRAGLSDALGVLRLPVADPRGHDAFAVWHGGYWMIKSGCRWLTADDARAHWSSPGYHTPSLGAQYVAALDWLDQQETPK